MVIKIKRPCLGPNPKGLIHISNEDRSLDQCLHLPGLAAQFKENELVMWADAEYDQGTLTIIGEAKPQPW